jgi:hypothetical protein
METKQINPILIFDNKASSFLVKEKDTPLNYLSIDTLNGSEKTEIGNVTTNPELELLGTGLFKIGGSQELAGGNYIGLGPSSARHYYASGRIGIIGADFGVGTITPGGKLHVYAAPSGATPDASADDTIIESNVDIGLSMLTIDPNDVNIYLGSASNSKGGLIRYNHDIAQMQIGTNLASGELRLLSGVSNVTMQLDGTGKVGIGFAPSYDLDVNGTIRSVGDAYFNSNLYCDDIYGGAASGGNLIIQSTSHATKGNIYFGTAQNTVYEETTDYLGLGGQPTSRLTIIGHGLEDASINFYRANTNGYPPHMIFSSSRGVVGGELQELSGDSVGQIHFRGYDGSTYQTLAYIQAQATEDVQAAAHGGELRFAVTKTGTSINVDALVIENDGTLNVGNVTDYELLITSDDDIPNKKYVDNAVGGSGHVVGPGSSTDNAVARFDGVTGKLLQDSDVIITDIGNIGAGVVSPAYRIDVAGDGLNNSAVCISRVNNNAYPPYFFLRKARGTIGSETQTLLNDSVGLINFQGYSGAGYKTVATIDAIATEDVQTSSHGGELRFNVIENGTAVSNTALIIANNGDVTLSDDLIIADDKEIHIGSEGARIKYFSVSDILAMDSADAGISLKGAGVTKYVKLNIDGTSVMTVELPTVQIGPTTSIIHKINGVTKLTETASLTTINQNSKFIGTSDVSTPQLTIGDNGGGYLGFGMYDSDHAWINSFDEPLMINSLGPAQDVYIASGGGSIGLKTNTPTGADIVANGTFLVSNLATFAASALVKNSSGDILTIEVNGGDQKTNLIRFKDNGGNTAYLGFPSDANDDLYIQNETAGKLVLQSAGSLEIKSTSNRIYMASDSYVYIKPGTYLDITATEHVEISVGSSYEIQLKGNVDNQKAVRNSARSDGGNGGNGSPSTTIDPTDKFYIKITPSAATTNDKYILSDGTAGQLLWVRNYSASVTAILNNVYDGAGYIYLAPNKSALLRYDSVDDWWYPVY